MILPGATYPDDAIITMSYVKDIERFAPPDFLVFPSDASVKYPELGPNDYTTYPSDWPLRLTNTFLQDFYFNINVFPAEENLGSISSDVTRQVLVWNGFFDNNDLQEIVFTGDNTGITTGFSPTTYFPLEEKEYQVQVSMEGPATFDVTYSLDFEQGEGLYNISGQRVVAFTFKPDWSEGITEVYEYITSIDRTYSGKETRASVRSIPRRRMEYITRAFEEGVERFDQLFWENLDRTLAIPLWQHGVFFEHIPEGTIEIEFDTTDKGYQDSVILTSDERSDAIYEIESISDGSITLPEPTARDWDNVTVAPVRFIFAGETVETRRISSQLLENRASLEIDRHDPWIGSYDIDREHRGKPVWLKHPNRATENNFDYDTSWFQFDSDVSNVRRASQYTNPRSIRSYDFVFNGRGAIYEFHKFFNWTKGKTESFYMPLWERSAVLAEPITSGDSNIVVDFLSYETSYSPKVNREDVALYIKETGEWLLAEVVDFSEDETTSLSLDITIDDSYDIDEVVVFFMERVRFGSDRVEMEWRKLDLLETNLSFTSVDE